MKEKWTSFGWHVQEIDGHNLLSISESIKNAKTELSKPSIIIANTIKGKGVSFMEDNNLWHYRSPDKKEFEAAKKQLGFN